MDFAFSEDQEQLRRAAREMLADRYPAERVAELADSKAGWEPESWRLLAEQGWLGVSVPEDAGGLGLSSLDEAVLFEEAGRALYPGPFFSTVALGLPLLLAAGSDLIRGVVAGDRSVTLAWAEGRTDSIVPSDELAVRVGDGGLTGTKRYVPDLELVTDVLVTVAGNDGVEVHHVAMDDASESAVVPRSTVDTTRRLGELVLDGTPSTRLLAGADAAAALRATRLRALAAVAVEAVGVAQHCLDLAAAYTKEREQFGRVIGTYQAVSHKVADMYTATELARSLAYWAAWAVAAGDDQAELATVAAKSAATEAAVRAAESAIQAHGGIGFTWEHPLHRYYKRAQWLAAFEGAPARQRAEIAAALLGD